MNNQMAMALRNQMIRNPQQFAQNALRSGYFSKSKTHHHALEIIASGNEEESKNIFENLCNEHNVSVDDAVSQVKQQYYI